ncbi:MAG: polysaccharide biosynthesis/export family protein [Rikenellaceae bacterium]
MRSILQVLVCVMIFISCNTQKKVIYLQDNVINEKIELVADGEIRFKPNDAISIYVSSTTPSLAAIFNLSRSQLSANGTTSSYSGQNNSLCYTVDSNGEIDFPIFGKIKVAGMTKQDIIADIKERIVSSGMLNDPIVTVEFDNLKFSTIGEFNSPGSYEILNEKTSILEAISMSGDLTINGMRDRVFLMRTESGKLITYQLDLKSKDIFSSPAYYIQQNDVIYVEPNTVKTNQSTVNGNTVKSTSFWISIASFMTTLIVLIAN